MVRVDPKAPRAGAARARVGWSRVRHDGGMQPPRPFLAVGPQQSANLAESAQREWLVTDGLGGYAMGTVAGMRRRRYHALQVVAGAEAGVRRVGLVSLETVLIIGDRRVRLATDAWGSGVVDPTGHELLAGFDLTDGVPRWRWHVGDVILEREVATRHGQATIAVVHRVVRAPNPVRVELVPLCTWRDAHATRVAGPEPQVTPVDGGFVFEGRYRVDGPGWQPGGQWYRDMWLAEEDERGLDAAEDLWATGRFAATLMPGEAVGVVVRAGDVASPAPVGEQVVADARRRAADVIAATHATDAVDAQLVLAADQFVVRRPSGPAIVAGYPWFGTWGRDTMISYEGLMLATGRVDDGRALLLAAGGSVRDGLLANTTDSGTAEYNTIDATLWFLHAVDRHVAATGDLDLVRELAGPLDEILHRHVEGTRHGIGVDPLDGLLAGAEAGVALTWMDARVDGSTPVTPRHGKPVEVNALWINGLTAMATLLPRVGIDDGPWRNAYARALDSFARFARVDGAGLIDVLDGDDADGGTLRPNQLFAVSLPNAPVRDAAAVRAVVQAVAPLVTPLGLRTLGPNDAAYVGRHRGDRGARDRAYHQGTVWPWLIGPYIDACRRADIPTIGVLDGLERHLADWGLGSLSETADGDAPHGATGCPFQAWSVAEVLRVRRSMTHAVTFGL